MNLIVIDFPLGNKVPTYSVAIWNVVEVQLNIIKK